MQRNAVVTLVPESSETAAAFERYQDAYRTSETMLAFSETVKLGGIFLAGVAFITALVVFQMLPEERSGFPMVSFLLIVLAVLAVCITQVMGRAFRALEQILSATIDADANSSPFFSNVQRSRLMRLGKEPPIPESIPVRAA